jgi:hypothetical protein
VRRILQKLTPERHFQVLKADFEHKIRCDCPVRLTQMV